MGTPQGADYRLRTATPADEGALRELIGTSIRALGADDYTPRQIEAALGGTFGVDTALIRDGTYFAISGQAGQIVACGGWSRRRTLFGSDARPDRDDAMLDPHAEPARIRAFFIHPGHARRGLGRWLLEHCEAQAAAAGFSRCALMATLPGLRLYAACGYRSGLPVAHPLPDGQSLTLVPMEKAIAPRPNEG